jgi:hypothetical protein
MNLVPSKVGAEPKKIGFLVALVVVAGGAYLYNTSSGGGTASAPAASRTSLATSAANSSGSSGRGTYRMVGQETGTREFKPSLKLKNIEPSTIDPTLRLDLLTKLKTVSVEAGTRSLFEIGTAPPEELKVKEPEKIAIAHPFVGPQIPKTPEPPPEPKAQPIPLKFYGFVNRNKAGDKRAFFMDGEDIVIASEGDMVKKRYKIVRIGVNSAVVEDTEFKGNNKEQTLPLEAELPG